MSRTTSWDPDSYSQNARFVSELGEPLIELLEPRPDEIILDLGCGDGALTEKIQKAGSFVAGIDASRPFVAAAHARGLNVILMDGHRLALRRRFDAVFSNAALHWMTRPELVLEGVAHCLKPDGRFVGEFGGRGNVATIRAALHEGLHKRGVDPWSVDPWYYPSVEEFSELLRCFGFTVDIIDLIPRPTKLPGEITAWLELFAQPFTKALPAPEHGGYLTEVRDELQPKLRDRDGIWLADYVRLRFRALLR